jgi:nuclear transport factor 2 (NTF2) superfamily protein
VQAFAVAPGGTPAAGPSFVAAIGRRAPHVPCARLAVAEGERRGGRRFELLHLPHTLSPEATMTDDRPPLPPFTRETAAKKVQAAEDAWNTRDPERVAGAYTEDSVWRNRDEFVTGREEIVRFLTAKWERELDYALRKSLWTFEGNRIAVRFQYESHDADGQWYRSYGNENWEFDEHGYMRRREASINDLPIDESERRIFGARPPEEQGEDIPLQ